MTRFSARRKRAAEDDGARPPQRRRVAEATDYDLADAYRIMKAKVLHDGLARPQIESYEDFMNVKIPRCLSEHGPIVVSHEKTDTEHIIEILDVRFDRPSIREANGEHHYTTPHECHIRRQNYMCNVLFDVRYVIRKRSTKAIKHSVIFHDKVFDRVPCMKKSSFCASAENPEDLIECHSEAGGYYLSTGAEKVIIGQEGPRHNYPFVYLKDGEVQCEFRSFNEEKFRSTSTLFVKVSPPHVAASLEERRTTVPRITVRIPFVSEPLPVVVVFKLLGVTTPSEMLRYVCTASDPEWFRRRVLDALLLDLDAVVMARDVAVSRLAHDRGQPYSGAGGGRGGDGRYRRTKPDGTVETDQERCERQVAGLISTEFLPHQGYGPAAVPAKTWVFGAQCVRKSLLLFYGMIAGDSRDHFEHRRVQHSSQLMTILFRKQFTMWRKRMASHIRRELDNGAQFVPVKNLLQANIGSHLGTALSTGNFSQKRGANNMDNVAQVLSRTGDSRAPMSHVNRSANPLNKEGKSVPPRLQHPSTTGIIGVWDTPEGSQCGLIHNMAAMAGVRTGYPTYVLADAVLSTDLVDPDATQGSLGDAEGRAPVFVSGTMIGVTDEPELLLETLHRWRAAQDIPFDVSIYRTSGSRAVTPTGEVWINGDPGSFWWPLIKVSELPRLRDLLDHVSNEDHLWARLLAAGVITIVNKDEETSSVRVAFDQRELREAPPGTFTHMTIHPAACLSLFELCGPFGDHNQAPRNTYQAAMSKAAAGEELASAPYRVDTTTHTLWHPERPLVSTVIDELASPDGVSSLQNAVVAIMCDGGWNIEDSLIMDRRAVELGLFRSWITRTVRDAERKSDGDEKEQFGLPPEECVSKLHANYSKVSAETGMVEPGTQLEHNDVIFSKHVKLTQRSKQIGDDGREVDVEEESIRDRSTLNRLREPAIVEQVITTDVDNERLARAKLRSSRIPEVGNKFCCYDDATDICTGTRGWIPIKDVRMGDTVACLDPVTQHFSFEPVDAVFHYDVKDIDMYTVNMQQINLKVTMNHNMFVRKRDKEDYNLVEARDIIGKRVWHMKNSLGIAEPEAPPCPVPNVDNVTDFLYLFGFWMGDGWCDTRVTIAQTKTFTKERLIDAIAACGLGCNVQPTKIHIHMHKPLFEMLKPLSVGAPFKRLPGWCFRLSVPHARALLCGLRDSDGHTTKTGTVLFYSTSKGLVSDVQNLALCAGWSANMYLATPVGRQTTMSDGRVITAKHDLWRANIVTTSRNSPCVNHCRMHKSGDNFEGVVKYTGGVHCVTVKNHIVYVRRDGKPVWCGNSRHGQKGTVGIVMDHDDMPFNPETGMVPHLIMNTHCLAGDTGVSLPCGLSVRLDTVAPGTQVWSSEGRIVKPMPTSDWMDQGTRPVFKITLEDGRSLHATGNHELLVDRAAGPTWIRTDALRVDDRVLMALDGPTDAVGDDEAGWSITLEYVKRTKPHGTTFTMDTPAERAKSLAFFRLLGYTLADGHLSRNARDGMPRGYMSLGNITDAKAAAADIALITGKDAPAVKHGNNVYVVYIPAHVVRLMMLMEGVPIGSRVMQPITWPACLDAAPKSILREFVAGLFGGDGIMPSLNTNKASDKSSGHKTLTPVEFLQSTRTEDPDHGRVAMLKLCEYLERLGVPGGNVTRRDHPDKRDLVSWKIRLPTGTTFHKHIGVRYCTSKQARLSAATSYWAMLEIGEQTDSFVADVGQLYESKQAPSLTAARDMVIASGKYIVNVPYYSHPTTSVINNRRRTKATVRRFDFAHVRDVSEYFRDIGCLSWFDKGAYATEQAVEAAPTYCLAIKDIRPDGEMPVYDISVPETTSFVANGIVAHNSIPSRELRHARAAPLAPRRLIARCRRARRDDDRPPARDPRRQGRGARGRAGRRHAVCAVG